MEMIAHFIKGFQELLDQLSKDKIDQVITILHEARFQGRHVFILGLGRSAPVASKFVADLSKITRQIGLPGYKAICLADYLLHFSQEANEPDSSDVIHYQLDNLLVKGDVVIAITTLASSNTINRAIEIANRRGATTVAFAGRDGGRLSQLVDVCIQVPSQDVKYIENTHHVLVALITSILQFEVANKSALAGRKQEYYSEKSQDRSRRSIETAISTNAQHARGERSRESLEIFTELSRELADQMNLRDLLKRVLELTLKRMRASSGTIVVMNERGMPVVGATAYQGGIISKVPQEYDEIAQRGLAGWVLHNRRAALISNTRDDPRWLTRPWEEKSGMVRSAMCVPLLQEERVIGVMTLVGGQPGIFSEDDLSLLAAVAVFITMVNYSV